MEHLWDSVDLFLYTFLSTQTEMPPLLDNIIEHDKHMKYAVGVAFPGIIIHRVRMAALLQVLEYLLHENRRGVA